MHPLRGRQSTAGFLSANHANKESSNALNVVETTAQSSGAIVVERVLTAGHKP